MIITRQIYIKVHINYSLTAVDTRQFLDLKNRSTCRSDILANNQEVIRELNHHLNSLSLVKRQINLNMAC